MRLALKTFLIVFISEIGSTDQLAIAAIASHSHDKVAVFCGAMVALILSCLIGIALGTVLNRLPFDPNLVAGGMLTMAGLLMIWKAF